MNSKDSLTIEANLHSLEQLNHVCHNFLNHLESYIITKLNLSKLVGVLRDQHSVTQAVI